MNAWTTVFAASANSTRVTDRSCCKYPFADRQTALTCRGVYTRGEWCEMHHGENCGGNFVMIMMLLLVSIIIYYYINTFIILHQCTFNLLQSGGHFRPPCANEQTFGDMQTDWYKLRWNITFRTFANNFF